MMVEVERGRGEKVESGGVGKWKVMLNLREVRAGGGRIRSFGKGKKDGLDRRGELEVGGEQSGRVGGRRKRPCYAKTIITTTIV